MDTTKSTRIHAIRIPFSILPVIPVSSMERRIFQSKNRATPTTSIIIQIIVACLKFCIKDLK